MITTDGMVEEDTSLCRIPMSYLVQYKPASSPLFGRAVPAAISAYL